MTLRHFARAMARGLLVVLLMGTLPTGASGQSLSIDGYVVIAERRVSRTDAEYDVRANLNNGGAAVSSAVATATSSSSATRIVEASLLFGPVAAGGAATSTDTFTIRHNRTIPLSFSVLAWTVVATQQPANRSPIAVAETPPSFRVGDVVTLDGSGSTDPDGDLVRFAWTLVSKPGGSVAALQNAGGSTSSFVADRAGTYQVMLTVSDGLLTDERTISISTANTAPVANPGVAQTARLGTTVTLDGSGSFDVDGDTLTYEWLVVDRPSGSSAAVSNPAAARPTFSPDLTGAYRIQLVVVDDEGERSGAAFVGVSTENSPPVANAGADQSVALGVLVQLRGDASTDADGDVLAFLWEFVQVPPGSNSGLSDARAIASGFVADRRGTFELRLTVTDQAGAASIDSVSITTLNSAPVANAGADQSVVLGATAELDASTSTDVDGDPLSYTWSFSSVPLGSLATLSDSNAARPTFIVDRPGLYILQLVVSDGSGSSAVDTVAISTTNSRPTADAGVDRNVVAGTRVTLDGGGSLDPDGELLSFAWALTSVPEGSAAVLSDVGARDPGFTADKPGTYVAQLTVSDGSLTSAPDTITITTGNTTPIAKAGADPLRTPLGALVALDGRESSDADGHALTYAWAILAKPTGSETALADASTATPRMLPDVGGDYVVQLIVHDGFAASSPDTVLFRVNRLPVADAGPDQTGSTGTSVVLSGGGSSDPDGDPISFAWTLLPAAGSTALLMDATGGAPSFVPDVAGMYEVRLVVADGFNESLPDTAMISVRESRSLALVPPVTGMLTLATATLTASTSLPAPPGGLLVDVFSSDSAIVSVPGIVSIPAGETSVTFEVTSGSTSGAVTLTASAAGATAVTASVYVDLRTMSLTLESSTVGVNRSIGGTVALAQPAPAGGVSVDLASANPTIATVSPASLVPPGASQGGLTVAGVTPGDVIVTATAPGFAPAAASVAVRLTLVLGPAPFDVERGSIRNAVLTVSAPAPAGGLVVGLSSDHADRASVPASVLLPAGESSIDLDVTGVTEGLTTVHATAPGGNAASLDVSVIPPSPARIESSPSNGEGDVAVTRETILRFSRALAPADLITTDTLFAQFGGLRLPTRIHVSPDRKTVTLFYLQTLPASARVRVQFTTDGIVDDLGVPLDGDREGQPGGVAVIDFDTLTLTTLQGTAVVGRVFASQLGDGGINTPLAGVVVSVDGLETTLRTTTDAMGNFRLEPAPVGEFFVHIDGRAATNGVPVGAYYPVVGKKWESKAAQVTTISDVFLPLIVPGTLQPVSKTQDTVVTFPASVLAQDPRLAGVQITVPADSLYSDNGARGGMVGIAPVAPDRIPSPLPPGLNLPLVITVQTDGATNFDRPVPVCFPNLPDPATGQSLAAGAKSALWSFNHDIGDWEIVGPMTVSQSGALTCSDLGVGIRQPGWHGTQPGTQSTDQGPPLDPTDGDPGSGDSSGGSGGPGQFVCKSTTQGNQLAMLGCDVGGVGGVIGNLGGEVITDSIGGRICRGLPDLLRRWLCGTLIDKVANFDKRAQQSFANAQACHNFYFNCLADDPLGMSNSRQAAVVSSQADLRQRITSHAAAALQVEAARGSTTSLDDASPAQQAELKSLLAAGFANLGDRDFTSFLADRLEDSASLWRDATRDMAADGPGERLWFSLRADDPGVPTLRGTSTASGTLPRFILRPEQAYTLRAVSRGSRKRAYVRFRTATAGVLTHIPPLVLMPETDGDSDEDGLDDSTERILGTDLNAPDTDQDGVADLAEFQQGTDPLDGIAVQTGVLRSVQMSGTTVDVMGRNDIAVVANSQRGISVLNVSAGLNPVIVAQVDTPGDAHAVAFEDTLVAVADGPAGLAIVDISDPPAARIVRQLDPSVLGGRATAVAVAGGTAYVGLDTNRVVTVDLATGAVLETVALPSGPSALQDLAIERDTLYVLTVGHLHAIPLQSPLQVSGSVSSPASIGAGNRRLRLFAGGGLAYATHASGYNTFSLVNPRHPTLISAGSTAQVGWKQIVVNGSGLGFAAVGLNTTDDGPHNVSLYDVSDPTQTDRFITEFETPGIAAAVSIYNGIGYVADSESGLQVVNYLALDRNGIPPTIALESNFSLSPAGGTAEEGQVMRVTANVDDDVQVRNVEFFVNGASVARDGNFPFEHRFVTPLLAASPSFTIRACAFDTGGNRTCTTEITVTLVEDATPPKVLTLTPPDGSRHQHNTVTSVSATFSETIDTATFSASTFQLFSAGPDGQTATTDDVPVAGGTVSYNAQSATAIMSFGSPLPIAPYRAVIRAGVSDLSGNSLGADVAWTFAVRGEKRWVSDTSGSWHTASNWSDNELPQPGDFVVIDQPAAAPTVTYNSETLSISAIQSTETLVIAGGSLSIESLGSLSGGLTISSGTLGGAGTVTATAFTMTGGQLGGTGGLTVSGDSTISGGFIAQRTLQLGQTTRWMTAGSVVSLNDGARLINPVGGTLTISSDAPIFSAGPAAAQVVNQGTLRQTAGTTEFAVAFDNSGTVIVEAGTLDLRDGGRASGGFVGAPGTTLRWNSSYTLDPSSSLDTAGEVVFDFGAVDVQGSFRARAITVGDSSPTFSGTLQAIPNLTFVSSGARVTFNTAASVDITSLTMPSGIIQGPAAVNIGSLVLSGGGFGPGGPVAVTGATTWTGGSVAGRTLTLGPATSSVSPGHGRLSVGEGGLVVNPAGATWQVHTGTAESVEGRGRLVNAGTLVKRGAGLFRFVCDFDNQGVTNLEEGQLWMSSGRSTGAFTGAAGTEYRWDATNGYTLEASSTLNTLSSVRLGGGRLVVRGSFDAASVSSENADLTFDGPGPRIANLAVLWGTATFSLTTPGSIAALTLNGVVNPVSDLTVGALDWQGGSFGFAAPATVTVTGTTSFGNEAFFGASLFGEGGVVRLGSQTTIADGAQLVMGGGTSLVNPPGGLLLFAGAATFSWNIGGSAQSTALVNQGRVVKQGAATATLAGILFANSGTADVEGGTLTLASGGFASGATGNGVFTGAAGTTLNFGAATLGSSSRVETAGVVTFSGDNTFDGFFSAGSVTFTGGTTRFNGSVGSLGSSLALANLARVDFNGAAVLLPPVTLDFGASLGGTASLTTTALTWLDGGFHGGGPLVVTGTTTIGPNGPFGKELGRPLILGSLTIWQGPVVGLRDGARIENPAGGVLRFETDAQVFGSGTDLSVVNRGTMEFGGTARTVSLMGPAFVNEGTLIQRLGGLASFDRIGVSQPVTFGGTLDVRLMDGFVPASGDTFPLFAYPSRSGQFDTILGNGETYIATYGSSTFTVRKP